MKSFQLWLCIATHALVLFGLTGCGVGDNCRQLGGHCTGDASFYECYVPGPDSFVNKERERDCDTGQVCIDGEVSISRYSYYGSSSDSTVEGSTCVDEALITCDPKTYESPDCVNDTQERCVEVDKGVYYIQTGACSTLYDYTPADMSSDATMDDDADMSADMVN